MTDTSKIMAKKATVYQVGKWGPKQARVVVKERRWPYRVIKAGGS